MEKHLLLMRGIICYIVDLALEVILQKATKGVPLLCCACINIVHIKVSITVCGISK